MPSAAPTAKSPARSARGSVSEQPTSATTLQSHCATTGVLMITPNVPEPAGAVTVDEWEVVAEGATPSRFFTGQSWTVATRMANGRQCDEVTVRISGTQEADGRVKHDVTVTPGQYTLPDGSVHAVFLTWLPIPQARELAGVLLAACDEIER